MPVARGAPGRVTLLAALHVAAAALAPAAVALPDSAAGAAAQRRVEWDLRFELEERYDDNILKLSEQHIDRLENLRPSDEAENRFSIETPDDFITLPRLSSRVKADWIRGLPTAFDLEAVTHQYLENPIKDYESFELSLSQPLHRRRRRSTDITLYWSRIPEFYLRNLISDRASEEQGTPDVRKEATYRKTIEEGALDQEILPDHLRFTARMGVEYRDYNRYFDERDSRMPFQEIRFAWDPLGDPRLRLRALYRREDLHAGGDLADTVFFVEDDISSRRDIVAADARLQWGKRGRRMSTRIAYEMEEREFSTTDPNDIYHFGRDDHRRDFDLSFHAELQAGWFLHARASRERNRSDFPTTPGSTFNPDDVTDYSNDIVSLSVGYEFNLVSSAR